MGLLDEAIREHLELKRRRGADPTEIERLEREALGPVRRGPQAAEGAVLEHPEGNTAVYEEPVDVYPAGPADEFEEPVSEPLAPETEAAHMEPETELYEPEHAPPEPEPAHEPFPLDESEQGWAHEPAPMAEPPPPAPAPAEPPQEPAEPVHDPAEHPGEETVEYDVEAEHRKEAEGDHGEGEDVLEETPEFLQDTPDHDRLWFEQRPPRDFDFDS